VAPSEREEVADVIDRWKTQCETGRGGRRPGGPGRHRRPAGPAQSVSGPRSTYIVELADPPVAAYDGGVHALAATSPAGHGPAARSRRGLRPELHRPPRPRRARVLSAARASSAPSSTATGTPSRAWPCGSPGRGGRAGPHRRRGWPSPRQPSPHPWPTVTPGDGGCPPDKGGGSRQRPPRPGGGPSDDAPLGQETPAFLGLPAGIWHRLGGPDKAGEGVKIGVNRHRHLPRAPQLRRHTLAGLVGAAEAMPDAGRQAEEGRRLLAEGSIVRRAAARRAAFGGSRRPCRGTPPSPGVTVGRGWETCRGDGHHAGGAGQPGRLDRVSRRARPAKAFR